MTQFLHRSALAAIATLCCWHLPATMASAQQDEAASPAPTEPATLPYYGESQGVYPDLFYNYYTHGAPGSITAEMYPAPIPTPPLVGHTYYTYQPLMPHEHMYRHTRVYYNYYGTPGGFYNGGPYHGGPYGCGGGGPVGINKTTVVWKSGLRHYPRLPLSPYPIGNLRRYPFLGQRYGNCRGCR